MESANNDARKWPILPIDVSRDFILGTGYDCVAIYYGGELTYYVFYTVVIVTYIYIYITRRIYYSGGLTFLFY
jgi:hypothetical protein